MSYFINTKTCISCKLCVEVCPVNIIDINAEKEVSFIDKNIFACIKCAQCMAVCPTKSVQIDNFSYENDFQTLPKEHIEYSTFVNFIKQRRSARNYKTQKISDDDLKKIINAVEYAPFGSAHDGVHFTIIQNKEVFQKALPIMADFFDKKIVKWLENPLMRKIIKVKKGNETLNMMLNHLYPIAKTGNYNLEKGDRILRNAPVLIIFHSDENMEGHTKNSTIYATYAMLAAQSLGLSAIFNSLVPSAINKIPELKTIFEIPKNHETVISLMIGHPKYKYQRTIIRKKTNVNYI